MKFVIRSFNTVRPKPALFEKTVHVYHSYVKKAIAMNKKFSQLLMGVLISFGVMSADCFGQDPQFSQFYAAPLYLNPAFTGSALAPRLTANYRNQWPSISANFVTSSFSIDHFFEKVNSGVGLLVTNDTQGVGRLKSTDVGLTYSYMFRLDEQTNVRFGMQGSYVNKSLDYNGLVFSYDYVTASRAYVANTTDPITSNTRPINYLDFSAGVLFFNQNSWFGLAAHHVNRPDQSFIDNTAVPNAISEKLPIKFSAQGGINIPIGGNIGGGLGANLDKQLVATPAFLYKRQGQFDQLDLGFYMTYSPMTVGLWYRGIPIKKTQDGVNNHDALIVLLGYRMDNFSIGYSYDLTISKLGAGSGGAHEISVSYQLPVFEKDKKNARQKKKELSCPKF
jgi:type IX secretion system PorP/SprF family membrane protein